MRDLTDLDALLRAMQGRYASNAMDRVFAVAFPFTRHESIDDSHRMILPIYNPDIPVSVAWEQLISCIASTEMEDHDIGSPFLENKCDLDKNHYLIQACQTPTIQLLRLFPHPSKDHWFPSWAQVQKYPDVSVRDLDSFPAPEGTDYSLRIMSGRVYRDCTLQLIQPSTPETKAIYRCTMDCKDAELVATVPGIELQIESGNNYVLVDISPDRSLWPFGDESSCPKTDIGHEHPPIWQTSVIIICEEVTTSTQLAAERATGSPLVVMSYQLRRVTTLEWDCRLSAEPGPGRWLPFKPSLVHLRSIVCSAKGGQDHVILLDPDSDDDEDSEGKDSEGKDKGDGNDEYEGEDDDGDDDGEDDVDDDGDDDEDWGDDKYVNQDIFCDPEVVVGLLNQEGWHEQWEERLPGYEVYLV